MDIKTDISAKAFLKRRSGRKSWTERVKTMRNLMIDEGNIIQSVEHKRLMQYGHLKRMGDGRIPKAAEWEPEGRRWKGKHKRSWIICVMDDMTKYDVLPEVIQDRWKC